MVGRLQIQPVETIRPSADVQPEAGGEQVPMLGDTAPAPVDPLGERLFPAVPAQAGLGQGSVGGGHRPSVWADRFGDFRCSSVARERSGGVDRLDELSDSVLRQMSGDIGLADDPDQTVVVGHGQAPDLAPIRRNDSARIVGYSAVGFSRSARTSLSA